ncbi:cytochrome c oxidase assembly factor 3 homolog, mitochondrial [Anolis carolinensis]|uniref:cytochrome c oxidase assembly factor 3 homolog, mitochondrial n=1 Tax=Anolis carolinensis TaxID=28377 RepID=UPI000462C3FF|nr:PREDICTED: cytochrome c oxidase assembly factor 3 homolog, mitochondrial [Anolis carolinensis]|eukprot:XP_008111372.1 PREDICTED: cytochrome c oxidase assembly factor 3 homolog, mitochondrial [Anolis carolinensis]
MSSPAAPEGGEPPRVRPPRGLPSQAAVDVTRRGLKVRNALTGLGIGAIVVGIYGYTLYSVSQERFLDELELEAEVVRARAAKTPTN